jgi:uncharacterized protein YqhQ
LTPLIPVKSVHSIFDRIFFFVKAIFCLPFLLKNSDNPENSNVGGQAVIEGVMMRGAKSYAVATRLLDGSTNLYVKDHIPWTKRNRFLSLPFIRGVVVLFESLIIGYKSLTYSAAIMQAEFDKAEDHSKNQAQLSDKNHSDKNLLNKDDLHKDHLDKNHLVNDQTEEKKLDHDNASSKDNLKLSDIKDTSPDTLTQPPFDTPTETNKDKSSSLQERKNFEDTSSQSDGLSATSATLSSDNDISLAPNAINPDDPDIKASLGFFPLLITLVISFGVAILFFVALPHFLSLVIVRPFGFSEENVSFHVVDGILKFGIFLLYVWSIGKIPDIKRVFAYHGAEHKAIYTYENKLPLEPKNAKPFPLWHPRCGTAFIFLLLAISVLFFAIIFPLFFSYSGTSAMGRALYATLLKTLLMFPLASISYEITKKAGAPKASFFWKAVISPGLLLQKLTTREPDDSQLEIAFLALTGVTPKDS